jgi:uncharacterized RDD family membrane protein YckC
MTLSASVSNLPPSHSPVPAAPRRKRSAAWKEEVTARVRAHRTGLAHDPGSQPTLPGMENAFTPSPSSIAARVAERYARIPSWREAMAAEAAAQAAPPKPVHEEPAAPRRTAAAGRKSSPEPAAQLDLRAAGEAVEPAPTARISQASRHVDQPDLIRYSVSSDSLPAPRSTPAQARAQATASALADSDIAEFSDPLEEALVEPTRLLPARVIEFPRELIAPRKARPRLAEGPLFDDLELASPSPASPSQSDAAQRAHLPVPSAETASLRILEAEPESAETSMPEWPSIQLDSEEPVRAPKRATRASTPAAMTLHVASVEDRAMSAIVDVALTLAAFLVFVLVFAACTTHPPTGRTALAGAGIVLFSMWVLYQFIFFSLSAATPGMRYAKIALCTFDDENPTRRAMRTRIAALLLSALPLGLGFLWVFFDEDSLSWHDRITQTYQRSYRDQ